MTEDHARDTRWAVRYPTVQPWLDVDRMRFDQLRRREFISLLGRAAIAGPLAARAGAKQMTQALIS
jgi:hypothetical protein